MRTNWDEFRITRKLNSCQNYVEHFVDPERKIFAFFNTLKLVKSIIDCLYNKKN